MNVSVMRGQTAPAITTDTMPTLTADTLSEVVIKAERIRYDAEGYRVNIATLPQLQGMNLEEMMNYLPGVTVKEKSLGVYGNQVARVYLNGKQLRLSGEDLLNYLSTIDGRNVRSVQVIASAGAELSAQQGGMAVLKISTKRPEDGGMASLGANAMLRRGQWMVPSNYNIEQRSGKWSVYAYGHQAKSHSDNKNWKETYFEQSQTKLWNNNRSVFNNGNATAVAGIGYDFSPRDELAVDVQIGHQKMDGNYRYDMKQQRQQEDMEQYANVQTLSGTFRNHMLTATYCHRWNTGSLTAAANTAGNDNKNRQQQEREGNPQLWNTQNNSDSRYRVATAEANFEQRLGEQGGTLKAGTEYAHWNNHVDSDVKLTEQGQPDSRRTGTDHYRYREQSAAAYASWNHARGAFSWSAGLRYEHRVINPRSASTPGQSYRRTYNELFPNMRLNYAIDAHHGHNLRLSASRHYNVPSMMELNPYVNWEGEYSYSTGNPYLMPAVGWRANGILTLWKNYSLTASYINTDNFENVYEKEADSDIYFSTSRNGAKRRGWSLGLSAMQTIGPRVIVNLNASKELQSISYQGERVHNNQWTANLSCSYRLPKDFRLSVSGSYSSPMKSLNRAEESRHSGSIRLNRSFMKNSLNVGMSYTYSPNSTYTIDTEGVSASSKSNISAHRFGISARYMLRWGNKRAKVSKSSHGNAETGRM